ncbi:MAG: hypothetical protein LIP01_06950 [Tannerellaceae bacterium]|nr:hypothetical protein [Tannerellaceae bacterium]
MKIGEKADVFRFHDFAVALFDAAIEFFEILLRLNPRYNGNMESDLTTIKERKKLFFV